MPLTSRGGFCGLSLILAATSWAQSASSVSPIAPLARTIREAVDPAHARQTVLAVYATDRWFTFPKFAETARYLKVRLEQEGVQQVEIGRPPADGRTQVGYWTMPLAWDVQRASLQVTSPEKIPLCDYAATPSCLGMWSGPTPPGGIDAELVDPEISSWESVRGKLVLTARNSAGLKHTLVKYGALGAVNGFSENPELGNDRQWINAWGDAGWGFIKGSTPLLSYSVTPNQADRLRSLLAKKQKVVLHAESLTRYYEGEYPWVTGVIPGADAGEETLVLGHTSEQGAQDNATGVAASVEALATLNRLISSGKLPKPRRGIRILLMPELYGSLHYIQGHQERMRRTVAAMTVDTPAASYDLAGTEYTFYKNPHAAKSWTDALILRAAQAVLPRSRPWHAAEHTTGTDAYLGEPTVGVPDVWVYSGTGTVTHHNSADIPETVDLRSLGDLTAITATYLYYAANSGEREIPWLASITLDAGLEDIRAAAVSGMDAALAGNPAAASFVSARIAYLADRSAEAMRSVSRLAGGGAEASVLDSSIKHLNDFRDAEISRLRKAGIGVYARAKDQRAISMVVRRKRIGTIPLDDLPREQWESFPSGAWDKMVTVALYWCDGKRSLQQVLELTEMEMGRPLNFDFPAYFQFLERHGYVEFVR